MLRTNFTPVLGAAAGGRAGDWGICAATGRQQMAVAIKHRAKFHTLAGNGPPPQDYSSLPGSFFACLGEDSYSPAGIGGPNDVLPSV